FENFRQLMDREPDPVIGDAALREVVGADPLAPLARPDLALARRGDLGALLLLRLLEEAGPQDAHRLSAVLDLRALVLAGDHEPGGKVRNAHRRVRGVDPLPSGPRRAIDVDLEVLLVDLHVDVLRFGEDRHRHGRRVNAAGRLRGGDPLDAMHAALELEPAPGALALDGEDDLLEAALAGR